MNSHRRHGLIFDRSLNRKKAETSAVGGVIGWERLCDTFLNSLVAYDGWLASLECSDLDAGQGNEQNAASVELGIYQYGKFPISLTFQLAFW